MTLAALRTKSSHPPTTQTLEMINNDGKKLTKLNFNGIKVCLFPLRESFNLLSLYISTLVVV